MKWLYKLERKFGKYAIHNFVLILTLLMACVYILDFYAVSTHAAFSIVNFLAFDRDLILQGQIWRLISFIIMPPETSIIFVIFALYMFYIFGKSLEDHWGSYKLNVYYLTGMIGTIIGGFIAGTATNVYLNLSLFLAFAAIFPDEKILIFFIIPVKVKYLAYIAAGFFVLSLILFPIDVKLACAFSIANFLIFFGPDFIKRQKNKRGYKSVQKNFRKEMRNFKIVR
jgi:Predicted membrane protein